MWRLASDLPDSRLRNLSSTRSAHTHDAEGVGDISPRLPDSERATPGSYQYNPSLSREASIIRRRHYNISETASAAVDEINRIQIRTKLASVTETASAASSQKVDDISAPLSHSHVPRI